jgi:hypothetical protein
MSKNEPFDCEKLIDMRADQLDSLIKECELNIERLRIDIVKTYQQAQPYLIQLTALKRQLKQTSEKMEAAKTFLSMENNGSLVSNIDIKSMEKSLERNKLLLRESEEERPEPDEPKGEKPTLEPREPKSEPKSESKLESKAERPKREKSVESKISRDSTKFRSPLVDNWTKSKEMEEKRKPITKPPLLRNTAKRSLK